MSTVIMQRCLRPLSFVQIQIRPISAILVQNNYPHNEGGMMMLMDTTRSYCSSSSHHFALKPGTPIVGVDIFKDRDPQLALEREEYPEWMNQLAIPELSLNRLTKLPFKVATDHQKRRYLKLTRRKVIKQNNASKRKD